MDGKYKSLAIKQIINEELAHRPIDINFVPRKLKTPPEPNFTPPQAGANDRFGVPLFNYYDNDQGQKQTTMFLLSSGEPTVKLIVPAVYQLCHPRFALEGLKDQHARTEIFMRGIQAMRNKLNKHLLPELTTIVEEYASLHIPVTVAANIFLIRMMNSLCCKNEY